MNNVPTLSPVNGDTSHALIKRQSPRNSSIADPTLCSCPTGELWAAVFRSL